MPPDPSAGKAKSRRGFASMDPERHREISRRAGAIAHERGAAHRFTPDEAKVAGAKGGQATKAKREAEAEREPDEGESTDD